MDRFKSRLDTVKGRIRSEIRRKLTDNRRENTGKKVRNIKNQ